MTTLVKLAFSDLIVLVTILVYFNIFSDPFEESIIECILGVIFMLGLVLLPILGMIVLWS